MEYLRSITISITVDTNKRTATETFEDIDDAKAWLDAELSSL